MDKTKKHHDVSDYEFRKFSNSGALSSKGKISSEDEVQEFNFQSIEGLTVEQAEKHETVIKLERENAHENNFKVAPYIEEYRGLKEQSLREREQRIQEEVTARVQKIEEEAYQKGFEQGVNEGKQDVYNETKAACEEKILALTDLVNEVLSAKADIFKAEKQSIYEMIRNLSRWVILKEIENDEKYLERLLEKLILEMQAKSNLLVQVNRSAFESMPDILEQVEKKVGTLTNVRFESDYQMEGPGIILSSDNGIINGSLKEQFRSLDKLFESVGVPPLIKGDAYTLSNDSGEDDGES